MASDGGQQLINFKEKILLVAKCMHLTVIKRYLFSVQNFIEDSLIPHLSLHRGDNTYIHSSVNFKSSENIRVGSNVRIQPQVILWASPNSKITIGNYSGLGPGTKLFSSNHDYKFEGRYIEQAWIEKDIEIGENVWIGAGCIITAGVSIGEGSVVGAGSVVTKSIPPYSLAIGSPAKVVKQKHNSVSRAI
jgi:acetyltransferase-like isoleucine patch superfamily enzyme